MAVVPGSSFYQDPRRRPPPGALRVLQEGGDAGRGGAAPAPACSRGAADDVAARPSPAPGQRRGPRHGGGAAGRRGRAACRRAPARRGRAQARTALELTEEFDPTAFVSAGPQGRGGGGRVRAGAPRLPPHRAAPLRRDGGGPAPRRARPGRPRGTSAARRCSTLQRARSRRLRRGAAGREPRKRGAGRPPAPGRRRLAGPGVGGPARARRRPGRACPACRPRSTARACSRWAPQWSSATDRSSSANPRGCPRVRRSGSTTS